MAGKKMMVAELKISPSSEFTKKSKDWIKSNPDLAKLFKEPLEHSESLELDDSKWSEKKLAKALEGLVVYELKYLASAVGNAQKEAEKSPDKLKKIIDKDLDAALKDTKKLIKKKCKKALEELKNQGAAEEKKFLKEGLEFVREISSVSLKGVFSGPAGEFTVAYNALIKELGKAEADEALGKDEEDDKKKRAFQKAADKRRDAAYTRCARTMKQVKDKYEKNVKQIISAVDALEGLRKSLKRMDIPEVEGFAKDVDGKIPAMRKLQKQLEKFENYLMDACGEVEAGRDDCDNVKSDLKDFERKTGGLDSKADQARKDFADLAAHFKRVEGKLG
ncbi:hypothetical protein OEW28_11220 [Defluviimonas sp. WL0002]|uniref:Uncharacterized protein n=1 Tax=Albidovulum marisflavi TaxID=2984159 RepID=A0ABT2ZDV1_9RHOB|nr:hypothetical protein [Defluviimonas sp. WL0002]MCV2869197.1 hypothetical protein [Defluviimonas sp. WL0002]